MAMLAGASNVHAQMPVRLSPRLARRAHAVSAALGRFHAPLTVQVPRIRPFRPFYPLRTRWRPMILLSPCNHSRPRLPPHHRHPQRTDAHGTHAHPAPDCAGGAGCFGGFCCTDRALHVGRAAACLAGPAAVCLPLHPPAACARARSIAASTRPLSAARRCRSGCECRRC